MCSAKLGKSSIVSVFQTENAKILQYPSAVQKIAASHVRFVYVFAEERDRIYSKWYRELLVFTKQPKIRRKGRSKMLFICNHFGNAT